MKKLLIFALIAAVITAVSSCSNGSLPQPVWDTPTITPTGTETGTMPPTATITQTPTATATSTELATIIVDDFEDGTLAINLIDPPNNAWEFNDDSILGGTSAWNAAGFCSGPYGQAISLTGTVRAHNPTTGQFMGLLAVSTTVKTDGQGIDATKYSGLHISMMCNAVAPSGNMYYTYRLYNAAGQFADLNPMPDGEWITSTTSFGGYEPYYGAPWTTQDVLSNLSAIEVRVQLFTVVEDAETTFNLCLDQIEIAP